MKTKKLFSAIVLISIFVMPSLSLAASCEKEGYTVFFLNGVWNKDEKMVQKNKESLESLFEKGFLEKNKISFEYLYNPSHIGGLGDLKDVLTQLSYEKVQSYSNDLDLLNIRNQLADKLNTQKFVIVSHSQGNLYANALVSSLGLDGKPFVKVYPVASPSSYALGSLDGKHITSTNDKVIVGGVRDKLGKTILSPNVTLEGGDTSGHAFKETYLDRGGEVMVEDISLLLNSLEVSGSLSSESSCISHQNYTFDNYIKKIRLAWLDLNANTTILAAEKASGFGLSYASLITSQITYSVKNTFSLANSFGNAVLSSIATGSQMAYEGVSYVAKETLYLLNLGLGVADGGPAAVILAQSPTPTQNNTSTDSVPLEIPQKEEDVPRVQKEEIIPAEEEVSSSQRDVSAATTTDESLAATTTPTEALPTKASSSVPAITPAPSYSGSGGVAASPAPTTPARTQKRCEGDESLTKQREEGDAHLILKETSLCNTYIFPRGITLLFGESLKNSGTITLLFGEEASFNLSGNNSISLEGEAGKEVEILPLESGLFAGGLIFSPGTGSSTVSLSHTKISSFGKRLHSYGGLAPLLETDETVKLSLENVIISSPYKTEQPHLLLGGESFLTNSSFETMLTVRGSSTLERVSIKNISKGIVLPLKETLLKISSLSFENVTLPLEVHGSHTPLDFTSSTFTNTPKEIFFLPNLIPQGEENLSYVWDNPGFTYRFGELSIPKNLHLTFKNSALITTGSLVVDGGNLSLASSTFLSVGDRNFYRAELSVQGGGSLVVSGGEVSTRLTLSGSSTALFSHSLFSDRGSYGITLNESSLSVEDSILGVISMNLAGSSMILSDSTVSHLEPIYLSKTATLGAPSSLYAEKSSFVFQGQSVAYPYGLHIGGGCFSSDGFEDSIRIYIPLVSCSMDTNSKHLYSGFGGVENGATLSVLPGTDIKIAPAGKVLISSGSLRLLGSAEKPATLSPESFCVDFIVDIDASLYGEYARLPECSSYGSSYYETEDVDGSSLIVRGSVLLKNSSIKGLISLLSGSLSLENVTHRDGRFFIQGGYFSARNSLFSDSEGWGRDIPLANSSCGLSSLVFDNNIVTRDTLGCLFMPLPVGGEEETSSPPESLSTPPTENFSETPPEEISSSTQDGEEEVIQPSQSFPQE